MHPAMARAFDEVLRERGDADRERPQLSLAALSDYDPRRDIAWYIVLPAATALLGLGGLLIAVTVHPLL